VSPSSPITLATGQITKSDRLAVELHRPSDSPAFVLLVWPQAPTVCNPHPRAIAAVATATVQLLATAQAALAKIKAERL
jgi:hypothetical protein